MSYKRLGDYIQPVNIRNKELEVTTLLGVSIKKVLMPSIANTIGTNMKTYKIIKHNQLAYGPVTSRNGDKISIALLEEHEIAIVSQAYTVFEVIDKQEVLPEYLMMWFRRPEFDRFARFKSHGSAREVFDWDELCDTQLPIPRIEKQQQIVAEYNTVTNRIQLNEKINTNLEATAQALYKHWFVDFEFPNAENKPHNSSGGEMVYNEELEKDIPVGWSASKFDKYVELSQGQVINAKTRHLVVEKGLPLLKITDLFNGTATMFIDEEKVNIKNIASKDDLIYTRTGQVGYIFRNKEGVVYNNCFKIIPIKNIISKEILYWHFKEPQVQQLMLELASGSAQADLTHRAFFSVSMIEPLNQIQNIFSKYSKTILDKIFSNEKETKTLQELQSLLLAKMTQQETKTTIV